MLEFLPQNIKEAIACLNINDVYELRLRANKPIYVNFRGKYALLSGYGITEHKNKALICTEEEIADCVFRAGNYSVYSIEEQIKQGFITANCGERLGLAGEYVFEKGQPLTIRNFTSLCIRIPHAVKGCAEKIYQCCMSDKVRNLLLMSPPGLGKTTILRDLARILSEKMEKNILICDERGEISVGELGNTCDVVRFCDKETAFTAGIRALRPDIILTDELSGKDISALEKAVAAGVTVLASAHFSNILSVKAPFTEIFQRYVLLDGNTIGKILAVYDEERRVMAW